MENLNQNVPLMGGVGMPEQKKSYGALIAVVVILFLIIIGGLYFLGQRMAGNPYQNLESSTSGPDPVTQSINQQSSSDETASIEADLNATNVDNVDQGAAAIQAEMQ